MNGATPSGPMAWVARRTTERTMACAGTGRREKRAMRTSGSLRGRYCEPTPTAIASSTPGVTNADCSPHAVKSRTMTSQASEKESERKKIQAKQTIWKVRKRCQARRRTVDGGST